jgi:hypothetical protein
MFFDHSINNVSFISGYLIVSNQRKSLFNSYCKGTILFFPSFLLSWKTIISIFGELTVCIRVENEETPLTLMWGVGVIICIYSQWAWYTWKLTKYTRQAIAAISESKYGSG